MFMMRFRARYDTQHHEAGRRLKASCDDADRDSQASWILPDSQKIRSLSAPPGARAFLHSRIAGLRHERRQPVNQPDR